MSADISQQDVLFEVSDYSGVMVRTTRGYWMKIKTEKHKELTTERRKNMANVKILFDPIANTMNIWWGDPQSAYSSMEVDDPKRNDVIVMDKHGKPISIEFIGVFPKELNISDITQAFGTKKTEPFLLTN